MLERLVIHDVVLIDRLALQLGPRLNVFTGETGAGKSILLDALGLALGERSDASLVRTGAAQAAVAAEFNLPDDHSAFTLAAEQGLGVQNPLILRRVIGKDGKSRAFVNDQPVSIALLRQFGAQLVEVHSQFETQGLLNPSSHRGLLDAFGLLTTARQKTTSAFTAWKAAEDRRRMAAEERARAQAEEEFLRAAAQELEDLAPEASEADQLAARRTSLQHREKITEALQTAEHLLNGHKGASAALAQAGKAVARIADKAEGLEELLAAIDRAGHETFEASERLKKYLSSEDDEPAALQRIEERLFTLRAVARKHGVQPDKLSDLQRDFKARLELLSDQDTRAGALTKAATEARRIYIECAEFLGAQRRQAAERLEKALAKELPPLKLERAQFKVEVAALPEDQWAAEGMDRVAFRASTNPGAPLGALQKVASGGELARFMLALKVVLAASDPVPVLVFDEVDSGIGGATASAVGERLGRLAENVQILVVTHSPQVAARGDSHLRVSKQIKGKQAITAVEPLEAEGRHEEIARMLAGTIVTEAARQAALSLLDDASDKGRKAPRKRAARS
ncbi:MAG: DNA repair protein RecN [Pseudomonadota bacterium]|nr:DNA repair protein RecN [Pseudomonadota bacterium]